MMIIRKRIILNLIITLVSFFLTLNVSSQSYDIYVSDAGDFQNGPWQILKFDSNGQNPVTFIEDNLNWPQDILFFEDSNFVLISNFGSGKISRYNATNGKYINDFARGIGGPTRMKIGADSLLYVLQWYGNGKVKRYNLDGTFIDDFTSVGVKESIGLDWDQSGNLYVSSFVGGLVRKFDTTGADLGVFVNTKLLGPTNIWFDSNGDLLVSDYKGTAVKRFDSSGAYLNDFLSGTGHTEGVAFLENGNILIGNGTTSSVKLFSSSGTYLQDLIPYGSGNLMNPNAIVIREVNSSALIPEIKEEIENVIFPIIGTEFHINQQYADKIESVTAFNSAGKVVETFNNGLWSASDHNNGIYFIVVDFCDGSTFLQKIIVEK